LSSRKGGENKKLEIFPLLLLFWMHNDPPDASESGIHWTCWRASPQLHSLSKRASRLMAMRPEEFRLIRISALMRLIQKKPTSIRRKCSSAVF
jgi:hypothetical protein